MSQSSPTRPTLLVAVLLAACTVPNPDYGNATLDAGDPGRAEVAPMMDAPVGTPDAPFDGSAPDGAPALDSPLDLSVDTGAPDVAPLDGARPDSAVPEPPTRGLIGHWTFDEGAGDKVSDASGAGNHGSIVAPFGHTVTWQDGKRDRALEIANLVGLAVTVGPSVSLDALKNSFSIAAWVKRTTDVGNKNAAIVSRQYGVNNAELYTLSFVNNGLVVWLHNPAGGASISIKSTSAATTNRWIHTAVTWDGATIRLFQDGAMVGSGAYATTLPATNNPVLLGNNANQFGLNQPLAGVLDDVRIYERPLTDTEIQALAYPGDL